MKTINPESWERVKTIFYAALERRAEERAQFVREVCANDAPEVQAEIEALLAAHEASEGILEEPILDVAAQLLFAHQTNYSLIGQSFGDYQILALLGAGGMGEVFLARDTRLERNVALKLLHRDFNRDRERVARFQREARIVSTLNHPNILTIYEVGAVNGRYFIATEYVEGETLRARLQREPLNVLQAIETATQIAVALAAAHRVGVVHRDLKPENLMLRPDGYVKVLDLGLAKLIQTSSDNANAEATSAIELRTQPNILMGTPQYMSPEQARGLPVDKRTDLWSLGVILYEMIAGSAPFSGATSGDVIVQVIGHDPTPLAIIDDALASATLPNIVDKLLCKVADERYQSAEELLVDLRRLKQNFNASAEQSSFDFKDNNGADSERQVTRLNRWSATPANAYRSTLETAPNRAANHRFYFKFAAALVAVAFVLTGVWLYNSKPKHQPFEKKTVKRITDAGSVTEAAISPDGKYVVYSKNEAGKQSLWIKQLTADAEQERIKPLEVQYKGLTFSPDNNFVYYVIIPQQKLIRELWRVPTVAGFPNKVIDDVDSPVTFSPDGRQFAFVRSNFDQGNAIFIANSDGSEEKLLARRDAPNYFSLNGPAWSPDGKIIACSAVIKSETETANMNVVAVRVVDGQEEAIGLLSWRWAGRVAWLDGGGLVIPTADHGSRFGRIMQISYPAGEARPLDSGSSSYNGVSLTAKSTALLTVKSDQLTGVFTLSETAFKKVNQITSEFSSYTNVAWTPDNRIITASNISGVSKIQIMQPDGTERKLLTDDNEMAILPVISADGQYIIYVSNRAGNWNVWRMDVDGRRKLQLTTGSGRDGSLSCSPDGQWIIFTSWRSGKPALWKVSLNGGELVQLTHQSSRLPVVSPDGKYIACFYNDEQIDSRWFLAIIPFDGGTPINRFDHIPVGSIVRWHPTEPALTYTDGRSDPNIWSQPLSGVSPQRLTDFSEKLIFGFDWSRDGKSLAFVRGVNVSDAVVLEDSL